jgi:hypothetical protein
MASGASVRATARQQQLPQQLSVASLNGLLPKATAPMMKRNQFSCEELTGYCLQSGGANPERQLPRELRYSAPEISWLEIPQSFQDQLRCYLLSGVFEGMPRDCNSLDLQTGGIGISKCHSAVLVRYSSLKNGAEVYLYFIRRHPDNNVKVDPSTPENPHLVDPAMWMGRFFAYMDGDRTRHCFPELAERSIMGEFYDWLASQWAKQVDGDPLLRTLISITSLVV